MGDVGDDVAAAQEDDEDEDEAAYAVGAAGGGGLLVRPGGMVGELGDQAGGPLPALDSMVDPAAWAVELERVAPQLRVVLVADTKDWRSHMDKIHEHKSTIAKGLPDSRAQLQAVESDASAVLEKLQTRERFINSQLEAFAARYRDEKQRQSELEEKYSSKSEEVAQLTNELARVSKRLEEVKTEMNERGDNISDTSPLLRLSKAIETLTAELRQMDIRIGVAQLRLTKFNLQQRARAGDENAGGGRANRAEGD